MARKPRVYYPGAVYHVILRGNAGQLIFFDNRDRTRFYFFLQEGIERFRHRIRVFCLMNNHVSLAIHVVKRLQIRSKTDLNLAERMKRLLEAFC